MKKTALILGLVSACVAQAERGYLEDLLPENRTTRTPTNAELKVTGDWVRASKATGELTATGHVCATALPYRFFSDRVTRTPEGAYAFGGGTRVTTCSNACDHLHWELSVQSPFESIPDGSFTYLTKPVKDADGNVTEMPYAVFVENAWLKMQNTPVFWLPYWYYPLNTDYGWRFTPGYSSRWGGYILTGYVYDIANEGMPDAYSLGGASYLDYRTENGFGIGQTFRWGLKDFGRGSLKTYYAWDEDYTRYSHHYTGHHYQYAHWGSEVERERYRVTLDHDADFTERDAFRARVTYLSDSHFLRDFMRRERHLESIPANEAWYEHRELSWSYGGAVSGPVNDFYGGTARLPEGWIAVQPQPVWDLPVNYESSTRAGYLNRDYARYGLSDEEMYRYNPYIGINGRGADYQAFRADTFHRLSSPFKIADTVSIVPRTSYRCTYWSDSGDEDTGYVTASGSDISRHIWEVGATASSRASAWLSERWRHTVEPYLDYSFQNVTLASAGGKRYYAFDAYDRSLDWLDQFGFEGRGLPYNWHGIRPGIRNLFQQTDDDGFLREVLDFDVYAAVPFDTVSTCREGYLRGYPKDDEDGNYNHSGDHQVVPGTRIRYKPNKSMSFSTRTEYDCQDRKVSYANLAFNHRLADDFAYRIGYIGRDHRYWDYLPSNYERWNYEYANILELGFTHDVCDWFAWGPFIRHDCRLDETEEVGAWFDFLTDCLGYRFEVEHESSYRRIDGSKEDSEVRVMFYIYLRALGPNSALDFARF